MSLETLFYQKGLKFLLLHQAHLHITFQSDAAVARKQSALEKVILKDNGPWRIAKFKD